MGIFAFLAVGAAAGVFAVFGGSGGGGNAEPLVLEANRNGTFDIHAARAQDDLSRETELLRDVTPDGRMTERIGEETMTYLGYGMEHDGGTLISYAEDGEIFLGLVKDGQLIELMDGPDGSIDVIRNEMGTFAQRNDWNDGRCDLRKLEGTEAMRMGRGDICLIAGSYAYLVDQSGSGSEVERIDLSTLEEVEVLDVDGSDVSTEISSDGTLVATSSVSETGESSEVAFADADQPTESDDLSGRMFLAEVLNDGLLVVETDAGFDDLTYLYYPADDGPEQIVTDGEDVRQLRSPAGGAVALAVGDFEDGVQRSDVRLSVWDEAGLVLQPVGDFDGLLQVVWTSSTELMMIDADGTVWTGTPASEPSEIGRVSADEDVEVLMAPLAGSDTVLVTLRRRDDDQNSYFLAGSGDVVDLGDWASLNAYWLPGSNNAVVHLTEDVADNESFIAALDLTTGALDEFDEADQISGIRLDGSTVYYTARTGDDADEIEARRFALGSDAPEVLAEEAGIELGLPLASRRLANSQGEMIRFFGE